MTHPWPARSLDITRFAEAAGHLHLQTPVAALPRLLDVCDAASHPNADALCDWSLNAELRGNGGRRQLWLRLQAQVSLPTRCQRCLEPLSMALVVDRWFRFVADEASALAEDDECEEDLLVISSEMDTFQLLEDELLMAMPLIISHTDCQTPSSPALADDLPHPFAALAGWKKSGQ
jgi:uncharacterized protein